jgi:hypothetical protein
MTSNLHLRYRGRLQNPHHAELLRQEVEEICGIQGWPHQLWQENWADHAAKQAGLRGISFNTFPGAEMVWLTFYPDGVLQSLISRLNPTFMGHEADIPWQRMRIRLDRPDIHLSVCRLLRYLSGRYFEHFEVEDDSGYWQHRDEARFTQQLQIFDEQLRRQRDAASTASFGPYMPWGEA